MNECLFVQNINIYYLTSSPRFSRPLHSLLWPLDPLIHHDDETKAPLWSLCEIWRGEFRDTRHSINLTKWSSIKGEKAWLKSQNSTKSMIPRYPCAYKWSHLRASVRFFCNLSTSSCINLFSSSNEEIRSWALRTLRSSSANSCSLKRKFTWSLEVHCSLLLFPLFDCSLLIMIHLCLVLSLLQRSLQTIHLKYWMLTLPIELTASPLSPLSPLCSLDLSLPMFSLREQIESFSEFRDDQNRREERTSHLNSRSLQISKMR